MLSSLSVNQLPNSLTQLGPEAVSDVYEAIAGMAIYVVQSVEHQ